MKEFTRLFMRSVRASRNIDAEVKDILKMIADAEDLAEALAPLSWREQYGEVAHERDSRTVYTRSLYLLGARETTSPSRPGPR